MKLLLADDHWIVRSSLRHMFEHMRIEFEAVEAGSYQEAIELLESQNGIGLVVVDLVMPGFNNFEGLKMLRGKFPDIPVIVLSVHEDRESVMRCIELGVIGYVPKTTGAKELSHALEQVLAGDVYFPRNILSRDAGQKPEGPALVPSDLKPTEHTALTSREREVMSWVGRGKSDARIAEILNLSPNTIRVHIKNVMKKLGLSNRAETVHFAVTNIQSMLVESKT